MMKGKIKDIDFGRGAARYDRSMGRVSRRFYKLLVAQAEPAPGEAVLDAGCGTGAVLRMMADACPISGFGIDMAENMVGQARRKCPEMDIRLSRCESTPFEDNFFDMVVSCMAYHHFSDKAGFAKEAARILKPGGRLYIADPRLPPPVRKFVNAVFRLFRVAGEFCSPDEIFEKFAKYGFEPDGFAKDGYAQVVVMRRAGAK